MINQWMQNLPWMSDIKLEHNTCCAFLTAVFKIVFFIDRRPLGVIPRSTGSARMCRITERCEAWPVLEANPEDWARVIVTLRPLEVPGEHAGCDATRCSSVASDKLSMLRLPIFINKYLCNTISLLFKIAQIPWVIFTYYFGTQRNILYYIVSALFFWVLFYVLAVDLLLLIFKYSVRKTDKI